MREILFRGKTKTGIWIEGFLFQTECDGVKEWNISMSPLSANDYSEILGDYGDVIPESISQFTGLTDKNGKKIFEGDIVNICLLGGIEVGQIIYSEISCRFKFADKYGVTYGFDDTCTFEVIGNIHDNPELLKGGEG